MPARRRGWSEVPKHTATSVRSPCTCSAKENTSHGEQESSVPDSREPHNFVKVNRQSTFGKRIRRISNRNDQSDFPSNSSKDECCCSRIEQKVENIHAIATSTADNKTEGSALFPDTAKKVNPKRVFSDSRLSSKDTDNECHSKLSKSTACSDNECHSKLSKSTACSAENLVLEEQNGNTSIESFLPSMSKQEKTIQGDNRINQVLKDTSTKSLHTLVEQMNDGSHPTDLSSHIAARDRIDEMANQKDELSQLSPSNSYNQSASSEDFSYKNYHATENKSVEGESDTVSDNLAGNIVHDHSSKIEVQKRWRRLKNTVTVVNRMTTNKSSNYDLLEEEAIDGIRKASMYVKGDAGSMGAAAFEGVRTTAQRRRGRKGMEGLLIRQDKGLITFVQDFYVTCLKLPIIYFLIGVFLIPVALGLFFTPLYLLDANGLSFDGVMDEASSRGLIASTKRRCSDILNTFLYALSLSTTFGGSPVAAVSPYCLLVANMNTLLAQFLFVFLSGAVFARMSQPSQPIRCAKKAIIKIDDVTANTGEGDEETLRVFAIRLVLGGPTPCELVDAKICLTFRIFVALPNGSTFCSTQDLDLVRSEVSYLRYGLMVRHIIDKKSPLYGHTLETLDEGDASFSLTVMGLERSSMQPIFFLEDYFVSDGDVVWDGDYADFIHVNEKGQRVLDHSKIDQLKPRKEPCIRSNCGVEVDSTKKEPDSETNPCENGS